MMNSQTNLVSRSGKIHAKLTPTGDRYLCRAGERFGDPVSARSTDETITCKRCLAKLTRTNQPPSLVQLNDAKAGLVEALVTEAAEAAGAMEANSIIGEAMRTRRGWVVRCWPDVVTDPIRLKKDAVAQLRDAAVAQVNRQIGGGPLVAAESVQS